MTNRTVDNGSVSYTQFDAAGLSSDQHVSYVTQQGGNAAHYTVWSVPGRKIKRNGVTFYVKRRNVRIYDPPRFGVDRVNDYSMARLILRNSLVTVGGIYNPPQQKTLSDLAYPVPFTSMASSWDSNKTLSVMNKLREKLHGSRFDAGVFLAEGHQALALIADSAIRVNKAYHHLRRGDLAGTARSLFEGTSRSPLRPYKSMKEFNPNSRRALSSNWLELQYGWLPLVGDTFDAAQMLAHRLHWPLQQKTRAVGSRVDQRSAFIYDGWFPSLDPVLPYFGHKIFYTVHNRQSYSVYHKEELPSLLDALNLRDPSAMLWEKLPWSFVADWFIPIGQWLNARTLARELRGNTVVYSYRITKSIDSVVGLQSPNGALSTFAPTGWIGPLKGQKYSVSYLRSKSQNLDVPPPEFKPLAKAASVRHCLNALALVTQFAGRR